MCIRDRYEAVKTSGIGAEFSAVISESEAFGYLEAPITRLAGKEVPIPYNRELEYHSVPQVENIIEKAREVARLKV